MDIGRLSRNVNVTTKTQQVNYIANSMRPAQRADVTNIRCTTNKSKTSRWHKKLEKFK